MAKHQNLIVSIGTLFVYRSSFFTVAPRIQRSPRFLELRTPWLIRFFTGFSFKRTISFDRRKRAIYVFTTKGWFFNSTRRLKFDEVEHITYGFSSLWTSFDWLGRAHDKLEFFTVGLKLDSTPQPLVIARFSGEDAVGDLSTFLMGDSLIDAAGTQEDDSRYFVKRLGEFLGVPLGPPALKPSEDSMGRMWKCSECGRTVAPQPKCLYCGGKAAPADSSAGK